MGSEVLKVDAQFVTAIDINVTVTPRNSSALCPVGQFLNRPYDARLDLDMVRDCSPVTNCVAGEEVKSPATPFANRICGECPSGEFSNTVNAAACTLFTPCPAGSGVTATGSTTQDVTCAVCAPGKFSATSSTTQACSDCAEGTFAAASNATMCASHAAVCEAGEEQIQAPSPSQDRVCQACASGTFSVSNGASCQAWTRCGPGLEVETAGSSSSDRTCMNCTGNEYSNDDNDCKTPSTCFRGLYVFTERTLTSNRLCATCPNDTFSSSSNAPNCTAHSPPCNTSETTETAAPTSSSDRVCTPISGGGGERRRRAETRAGNCSIAQYFFNSTDCLNYTACPAGQYQDFTGNETADVTCANISSCNFTTHYVFAAATLSADVDCRAITACNAPQQQEKTAPTNTSDRVCRCTPGSFKNASGCFACAPGTATDDEVDDACTACSDSEYQDLAGETTCKARTLSCIPGKQTTATPTPTSNRVCSDCPDNTFSATGGPCIEQRQCGAGLEVQTPPTKTSDRVCQVCSSGKYSDDNSDCKTCNPGEVATASNSSSCTPCNATIEFQSGANHTQCVTKQECPAGQRVTSLGDATTNRACQACVEGYTTVANSATCIPHTPCNSSQYEAAAPTTTSDRVCFPLAPCNAELYRQLKAATNVTDRICVLLTDDGVQLAVSIRTAEAKRAQVALGVEGQVDDEGHGDLWDAMRLNASPTVRAAYDFTRIELLDQPGTRSDNPPSGQAYVYFKVQITPLTELAFEQEVGWRD